MNTIEEEKLNQREDNFMKDRRIEKETYAIINYFQLFEKAFLMQDICIQRKETYMLIGGPRSFNRLILDCEQGYIDIFKNNLRDLLRTLQENTSQLKSPFTSHTVIGEEQLQLAEIILEKYDYYLKEECSIEENAYLELCAFPIPEESLKKLASLQPKQKKLGER